MHPEQRREGVAVDRQPTTTPEEQRDPRVCGMRELKQRRECGLDNTLSETFPCSDPLSSIPDPTSF